MEISELFNENCLGLELDVLIENCKDVLSKITVTTEEATQHCKGRLWKYNGFFSLQNIL